MEQVTEKQRQELIKLADIELSEWDLSSEHALLIKIALASLTAECEFFQWKWVRDESAIWTTTPIDKLGAAVSSFGKEGENVSYRLLYTAPPVPANLIPPRSEVPDKDSYHAGYNDGFNDCRADVKSRLSGAMPSAADLIRSEIADFCAGLSAPGEPATPEEIQRQLTDRIMPILGEE